MNQIPSLFQNSFLSRIKMRLFSKKFKNEMMIIASLLLIRIPWPTWYLNLGQELPENGLWDYQREVFWKKKIVFIFDLFLMFAN